jgi:hypothetical protein
VPKTEYTIVRAPKSGVMLETSFKGETLQQALRSNYWRAQSPGRSRKSIATFHAHNSKNNLADFGVWQAKLRWSCRLGPLSISKSVLSRSVRFGF